MLGPGVLGKEEFERQQALPSAGSAEGEALNVLGSAFAPNGPVLSATSGGVDELRVNAKKAIALLKKDPQSYAAVLRGELTRPAAARRGSVLEALLDACPAGDGETREKLVEALRTATLAVETRDDGEGDEG